MLLTYTQPEVMGKIESAWVSEIKSCESQSALACISSN